VKDDDEKLAEISAALRRLGEAVDALGAPLARIAVACETLVMEDRRKKLISMTCEICSSPLIAADDESCAACGTCLDCGSQPGECVCSIPRRTGLQIIGESDAALAAAVAKSKGAQ